jgi:hypothetical protein
VADLSYPIVLLQDRKSSGDRFIECLRGDLNGVLDVSKILYRNCARSENHKTQRSIFSFCSLQSQFSNLVDGCRFSTGIQAFRASVQGFLKQGPSDAAIRPCDQDCFVL